MYEIRDCLDAEIPLLGEIESKADTLFPEGVIPADAENYPIDGLALASKSGSLLVATVDKEIVGFAVAEPVVVTVPAKDVESVSNYHLFLLAVLPQWGRNGIGTALVRQIEARAKRTQSQHLTLTTFSNIEWNAPYYEKLGFRQLAYSDANQFLKDILNAEFAEGFSNRIAMQLVLS